jgi:hypothetical protein
MPGEHAVLAVAGRTIRRPGRRGALARVAGEPALGGREVSARLRASYGARLRAGNGTAKIIHTPWWWPTYRLKRTARARTFVWGGQIARRRAASRPRPLRVFVVAAGLGSPRRGTD